MRKRPRFDVLQGDREVVPRWVAVFLLLNGLFMNSNLDQSFESCRLIARHHAKSFYFSSFFLPPAKQKAAYAIYAFCRHADDLLDVSANHGRGGQREELKQLLVSLYEDRFVEAPFGQAFHQTVSVYKIPRNYFEELIEGVCSDRGPVRIANFEELTKYCYRVASVVGLMMSKIFGLSDPRGEKHAIELGMAMQLTNILRDVREDHERDRIYLPQDEMAKFGVAGDDIRDQRVNGALTALMKFQIERARRFYQESEKGIPMLANDGSQFTVWAMRWIYAGILDEIENANYDVYRRRARVGLFRKLCLAWHAWRCCRNPSPL